jgi:hypothetical protein
VLTSLLAFSVVAPSPHKSGFDLRGPHVLQCGSCLRFIRQTADANPIVLACSPKKRSGFFRFDTYFNLKTMLQLQPQKNLSNARHCLPLKPHIFPICHQFFPCH